MRNQLLKPWKLLLLIGLSGLTVVIILRDKMPRIIIRATALFSKYRNLMPYIEAQARHETADFTSRVYKEDHNLFGMKFLNGRRDQVATRGLKSSEFEIDGTYYARYLTDSASVVDLLKWMDSKNFPTEVSSVREYAEAIAARNWFGSVPGNHVAIYVAGMNKYFKK